MPKINTYINLRKPVLHDISLSILLLLASRASVLGMFPFGITFFAACFDKTISYMAFFIISLGLILSSAPMYIMKYLISALLYSFFVHINKRKSIKNESIVCGCSVFLGGAVHSFCFFGGYSALLLSLIEGIIAGIVYIIFTRASEFMVNRTNRTSIARDELISVALCAGIFITGLSDIKFPMGISVSGIACVFVVLCIAYHSSLSSAGSAGVGIGFISSMSQPSCIACGGFYGLCALFGNLLKGFGKYGSAVGFLGGAAAALIYSKFGAELNINAFDIVIGTVIFTAIPDKIHNNLKIYFSKSLRSETPDTGERVRMYLSETLNSISDAFKSLNEVFNAVSDRRIKNLNAEAADLFEDTAQRVCRGCSTAVHCWERDFNTTYKRLLSLLDAVEKGEEIPECMSRQCVRSTSFVNEFLHVYEIYRERELFLGEALRSRDLSARQYLDISRIFATLSASTQNKIRFRTDFEDEIITELDKEGITLFEISVIEKSEAVFEICLGLNNGAYIDRLEEIIKNVTDSNMEFESEKDGIAKFVSSPIFGVNTGFCAVPCEGCEVSGDNIEIFEDRFFNTYILISDGMGCGYDARNESEGLIKLIKEFILAGFDVETAIKTVNSALCLRIYGEHTASLDMLCIDRNKGLARIFKIGCAETLYISENKFETLFPISLPAGLLENINLQPQTRRIHKGDTFIMASDGVTQCGGVFGEWAKKEYNENLTPQELSKKITDKSISKWNGAAFDDLSVVVVRIE